MTDEERNKKLAEAREKYGRPFIHERLFNRPINKTRKVLPASIFPHQKRPFNV